MATRQHIIGKTALTVFWVALLMHCLFQYLKWPYVAVTKPMLVPFLLAYLLVHDNNIGVPIGKFIFYVGMFLALFGDVLLISINDTFFLSGMIAFMLMNLCYSWSFIKLQPLSRRNAVPMSTGMVLMLLIGYFFYDFLAVKMGAYGIPVLAYMFTVSLMVLAAINMAWSEKYRFAAFRYFIPGAIIFMVENAFVALNLFQFNKDKDVYIGIMFTYGLAQYFFIKGVRKTYLAHNP